jgi:hypothetical protein
MNQELQMNKCRACKCNEATLWDFGRLVTPHTTFITRVCFLRRNCLSYSYNRRKYLKSNSSDYRAGIASVLMQRMISSKIRQSQTSLCYCHTACVLCSDVTCWGLLLQEWNVLRSSGVVRIHEQFSLDLRSSQQWLWRESVRSSETSLDLHRKTRHYISVCLGF